MRCAPTASSRSAWSISGPPRADAMPRDLNRDPDVEWLAHVQPVGLVVAPPLLKRLGLIPLRQTPVDSGIVAELLEGEDGKPALADPWAFVERVLGWEARHVAGAP